LRDVADPKRDPPWLIKSSLAMIHTKAFFAHIVQSRGPIAMGKNSSGPVKSERVPMSPSEQANRIRRAARQLQHGVMKKDLISQGFKAAEIEMAEAMVGGKK
jgi:hypothetical protein